MAFSLGQMWISVQIIAADFLSLFSDDQCEPRCDRDALGLFDLEPHPLASIDHSSIAQRDNRRLAHLKIARGPHGKYRHHAPDA